MIYDILPVNNYKGNNNSKKFDFDFYIDNESQIVVYLYDKDNIKHKLKLNVDYSINEVKNKNGSYISFPLSGSNYGILSENERISIELTLPKSQETQYNNSSLLNLEALEYSLDYLTRLIQILARKTELSVKADEGSDIKPDDLLESIKEYVKNAKNSEILASQKAQEASDNSNLVKDWAASAIDDVNAIKASAVNEVNKVKKSASSVINELVQEAFDAAQRAENEAYKVLLPTDSINQSKSLLTGGISSFPAVYSEIKNYAKSTFDLSKFTLVGNPIITDNSIASGFSKDNYITVPTIKFSTAKTWEIDFSFTASEFSSSSEASGNGNAIFGKETYIRLGIQPSGQIYLLMKGESFAWSAQISSDKIKLNTLYFGKVCFDGTSYKLDLSTDGGATYTNFITYNDTNTIFDTDLAIGINLDSTQIQTKPFKGSIDLKQFSIKLDGVEAFSGNKTKVDIIKPDSYKIIGSPVISEDGVASGFSSNSYLTIENVGEKLKQSKNWEMEFPVVFKDGTTTTRQEILGGRNATNPYPLFIRLWQDGLIKIFTEGITNDEGTTITLSSKAKVQANKEYLIKVFVENNVLYYYLNGELQDSHTISENIYFDDTISVGVARPGQAINVFQGSIDLNSFKIYADGKLIYQPCLKIPYTLSKTGSKIVDANYRNRVQDMYEQFGYAPYYTIDEENKTFTLPMGEIYGMIEKTRKSLDDIIRPIGKPIISMNNDTLNFDEIWLEGAKVLKTTYPKLTEIYGDTYAPSEAQDKDTYLYLPDFRKRTIWGSSDNTYGYIEAGLPNIQADWGNTYIRQNGNKQPTGAATGTVGNALTWGDQSQSSLTEVGFDASKHNPIYSDNVNTVQPPSFKVRFKTRYK